VLLYKTIFVLTGSFPQFFLGENLPNLFINFIIYFLYDFLDILFCTGD